MATAEPPPRPFPAAVAWTHELSASPAADAAADRSRIYTPLGDGTVVALDRATGTQVWSVALATAWPVVVNGSSLFLVADDSLRELESATGRPLRQIRLPGAVTGPMTRAGDLLLIPVSPDVVVAWHTGQGRQMWSRGLGAPVKVAGAVSGSSVYFALAEGRLVGVTLDQGRILWTTQLSGELTAPAATPTRVFVGSSDQYVAALDVQRGTEAWRFTTRSAVIGVAADGERAYVASLDNIVRALSHRSGTQQWRKVVETRMRYPPLLAGGRLVIVAADPTLTAFLPKDGSPQGSYTITGKAIVAASPVLLADRQPDSVTVVLLTDDEAIAIKPKPAEPPPTPVAPESRTTRTP